MNVYESALSKIDMIFSDIDREYKEVIENKWIIWIIIAIVIVATIAYAFYCTSKGYEFTGGLKLNWPKVWQMGIGCKPR